MEKGVLHNIGSKIVTPAGTSAVSQTGELLNLMGNGQKDAAIGLMAEMSKTSAGRAQLAQIHKAVGDLIPHSISHEASTIMLNQLDLTRFFAGPGI